MKNVFKMLPLFAMAMALFSCSTEEETVELSALERELNLEHQGVLEVGSTTYVFKSNGETAKFVNDDLQFDFNFTGELNFRFQDDSQKHAGGELLIINPVTDEFIKVTHIEQVGVRTIQFDAELSTGDRFEAVVLETRADIPTDEVKWHKEPGLAISETAIEAFIEPTQSEQCTAALVACSKGNGRAAMALSHTQSWFKPSQACQIVCN